MASIVLRHRTASSSLFGLWEFDPVRRLIIASIKMGRAPTVDVEIPVCSTRNPQRLSWVLVRKSAETWLLTSARMPDNLAFKIARGAPFHPNLPLEPADLLSTPPDVQRELEAL